MIRRFSLYGFLKNQRYYEPFIILFFLQSGLSYTQIGVLVGFRELAINLMEIPSGALADLLGRRRCMMLSFIAYIISFAVFGTSSLYWHFFIAMFFFSIGEAFRTGTHKAMIFTWLRIQGRLDEKTKVYGYTRSWSKIGSAVSAVLAVIIVIVSGDYRWVFFLAIAPYVAGLINFLFYPAELEGQPQSQVTVRDILAHLWHCLRITILSRPLRRLMTESLSFEGTYKVMENYIQPVVQGMALMLPLLTGMADAGRTAVLIGIVYVLLYLASAFASRRSERVVVCTGSEEKGSRLLWVLSLSVYALLIPLLYFRLYYAAVAGFIALTLLQNYWRPLLLSRFDCFTGETDGATVLSIESQVRSVAVMILAPVLGCAVDFVGARGVGGEFWPVAAAGAIIAVAIVLSGSIGANREGGQGKLSGVQ